MIGALRGKVLIWHPPLLILDVNGVGYELHTPASLAVSADQSVRLYTHLVVREDQLQLYGFESLEQRNVFRTLLKISGVGARMGLALLSTWQWEELLEIIRTDDTGALMQVPGIGKKTAEKLLIELRHRFRHQLAARSEVYTVSGWDEREGNQSAAETTLLAQQALEQLGYTPQEAGRLVRAVADPALDTAELIKRALQQAHAK